MAATYEIQAFHGASPTGVTLPANARFHRGDDDPTTDGSTTFIPIPTSGTNYSYRKSLKLAVTVAPTGTVSNLRFFSDAVSWGTGIVCYVKPKSAYTQASATDNTTLFDGTAVDVTGYTSASPLTVNAGTVLTATTGLGTQDYVVLQVGGGTTAGAGSTTPRTISYRVDET